MFDEDKFNIVWLKLETLEAGGDLGTEGVWAKGKHEWWELMAGMLAGTQWPWPTKKHLMKFEYETNGKWRHLRTLSREVIEADLYLELIQNSMENG